MAKYSTSQVQTYIQCPLKYRYKYVDKIPVEEFVETADIVLGKIVHASLEKLYKDVNNMKIPSKEQLLEYYHGLRSEKEKEAKDKGGEIVIHGEYTVQDYKARGESYLKKYYDKHSPFEDIKVIDTELNFVFELEEGISFQGIIDRLDKVGDTFIISDYKTNKRLPTEDKDGYIEQLTLYGIGIRQKYGKYFEKIQAKLYFLHFDIEDERELTQEKLDQVLEKYKTIIKEIEKKKELFALGNKKVFEAKQGTLCRFCDYQSICPLFNYINTDDEVAGDLSLKTIKALVDEFVELKIQLSELQKKEEGLKDVFLEYIAKKDPSNDKGDYLLQGTEQDVKISTSPKFTVTDKDKFLGKIKELGLFE
ncbi:MAG TPA: PD-(D/E)XK nuclease family protein, partial [Candidatus Absconditabacterales bacterium]|nr:PD-(D/E)XK nuclease family protein [Candidatus Absconditabacterales bacterium]